jgi:hypothetical protein
MSEEVTDPRAEADVENREDEPDARTELFRTQRGVEVAEVVLVQNRQPARAEQAGVDKGVAAEDSALEPLDSDHPHNAEKRMISWR